MNRDKLLKLLCKEKESLEKNIHWLTLSYEECKNYNFNNLEDLDNNKLVNLEALFSRFSRTIDILINKLLRTLDIYELENIDNKLDIVIRAEKRGFIENYEELIEMKDLKNFLSHEYVENLPQAFKLVLKYTPVLLNTTKKAIDYINQKYC